MSNDTDKLNTLPKLNVRECIWRARLRPADVARGINVPRQQLYTWIIQKHHPSKLWRRELIEFFEKHGVEIAYLKD